MRAGHTWSTKHSMALCTHETTQRKQCVKSVFSLNWHFWFVSKTRLSKFDFRYRCDFVWILILDTQSVTRKVCETLPSCRATFELLTTLIEGKYLLCLCHWFKSIFQNFSSSFRRKFVFCLRGGVYPNAYGLQEIQKLLTVWAVKHGDL